MISFHPRALSPGGFFYRRWVWPLVLGMTGMGGGVALSMRKFSRVRTFVSCVGDLWTSHFRRTCRARPSWTRIFRCPAVAPPTTGGTSTLRTEAATTSKGTDRRRGHADGSGTPKRVVWRWCGCHHPYRSGRRLHTSQSVSMSARHERCKLQTQQHKSGLQPPLPGYGRSTCGRWGSPPPLLPPQLPGLQHRSPPSTIQGGVRQ